MKSRLRCIILWTLGVIALVLATAIVGMYFAACTLPSGAVAGGRSPRIRPDYSGVVIPPNIAPLNFVVEEPGMEYRVVIHATNGADIIITSRKPSIVIPIRKWHDMLAANRGGRITFEVHVRGTGGQWSRFDPIENTVANEDIDSHLVYRLIGPLFHWFVTMGIYQRNLNNYDESPILVNESFGGGCVNCHTFLNNSPDSFSVHVRPGPGKEYKSGMIAVSKDKATRVKTAGPEAQSAPGFTSRHPAGSVAAFSRNNFRLLGTSTGDDSREVFDLKSHLSIVDLKTGGVSTTPGISDSEYLETFPTWSADGSYLYFCRAKRLWFEDQSFPIHKMSDIKYDLMRIRYNLDSNTWGEAETVLAAAQTGKSISEPRSSPDGRFLLFCMTVYGGFPPYQKSADLYLMELKTGKYRRLECNSDSNDSWPGWSSNSRWIVFKSKRDNGWLARPYFCYIDADGKDYKPLILPQQDPTFYDTFLKNYNVPELVTGPVTVTQEELVRAILCKPVEEPTGATRQSDLPADSEGVSGRE